MISASQSTRRAPFRLFVALIVLACLVCDAAVALASNPGETVGLQYMYTYSNCSGSKIDDPINVVWEGGEPTPGNVGRVLAHNGWSHNDYQSPALKFAHALGIGGVDSQYVHLTNGQCLRDDTQRATGNPFGNRNHVRLFSTVGSGKLWVVGDAHHDQVEGAWEGCQQAVVGGHITSSFNQGREALKEAWPASSRFATWGNTFEITQCNGEKKHSDGKVLFLNSDIAGIAEYDPENIEEPTLSGTPGVGNTLAVHPGSWTGNPASFVYEWCRVEPYEDRCVPYSGATGSTWTATSGSAGSFVGVMVKPTGADESDAVISQIVEIPAPVHPKIEGRTSTIRTKSGELLVFARDTAGELISFGRTSAGAWSVFNETAVVSGNPHIASAPSVIETASGELLVFAEDTAGELISFGRTSAGAWSVFNETAVVSGNPDITGTPSVIEPQSGELLVFARDTAGELISFGRTSAGSWSVFNETAVVPGNPHIE